MIGQTENEGRACACVSARKDTERQGIKRSSWGIPMAQSGLGAGTSGSIVTVTVLIPKLDRRYSREMGMAPYHQSEVHEGEEARRSCGTTRIHTLRYSRNRMNDRTHTRGLVDGGMQNRHLSPVLPDCIN